MGAGGVGAVKHLHNPPEQPAVTQPPIVQDVPSASGLKTHFPSGHVAGSWQRASGTGQASANSGTVILVVQVSWH